MFLKPGSTRNGGMSKYFEIPCIIPHISWTVTGIFFSAVGSSGLVFMHYQFSLFFLSCFVLVISFWRLYLVVICLVLFHIVRVTSSLVTEWQDLYCCQKNENSCELTFWRCQYMQIICIDCSSFLQIYFVDSNVGVIELYSLPATFSGLFNFFYM